MSFITPKEHLKVLNERFHYLNSKIESGNCSENSMHHLKSERAALKFAMNILIRFLGYNTPDNSPRKTEAEED